MNLFAFAFQRNTNRMVTENIKSKRQCCGLHHLRVLCFNKRIVLQRCSAGMPAEKERICQMSGKPGCCLREPKQSFNRGTQIS